MGSFSDFTPGSSPENSKSLNFLENDVTYVFIWDRANYHHFFLNIFMPSLEIINKMQNKNLHFVLYSNHQEYSSENYSNLLVELLEEKKINYTTIKSDSHEYINSKNFIAVNSSGLDYGIPAMYNYFINKYKVVEKEPNQKIYISRKKTNKDEKRIDNEDSLELFFLKNGFKIVYPEDIKTFKEQFELFNSCSVLAGLTGSGLTSLIFMQPHQIVIEIITKLEIGFFDNETGKAGIKLEIHQHYNEFCKTKNIARIGIHNMDKTYSTLEPSLENLIKSFSKRYEA
jgi:capsular polysaccharide biosynthesis protein